MKPLSSKKSNSKSPRRAKTKAKKWDQDDIPVLDPDECNTKFLNPKKGPNAATTKNKMKSVPLIPIPPSKDLPDSIRMIPRMMSPNLPSSIQPIINKRVELPPLEKTPQKFAQEINEISLPTRTRPQDFTGEERPIFGSAAFLTPVEANNPTSSQVASEIVKEEDEHVTQQYKMHKIIRAIREVAAEEAVPLNGAYGEPVEPTEIQEENCAADDAFNQLREHLKRGDTCPDVIIKSILTEIERPQTTPEETQRQTALLAEHLKKAGWDDQPCVQREHTDISLFSLLTRESSQISEWGVSLSRESSSMDHGERGGMRGPCQPHLNKLHSSDTDECHELPDEVSALIRRALVQVSNGISPMDPQEADRSDPPSVDRSGPHSSGSDENSPTGPPEPIVTENTFIFARDI